MDWKIVELINDGSIREVVHPHPKGWLSNVFLVPKKDGGYRMILNLKPLNKFIVTGPPGALLFDRDQRLH